MKIEEELRQKHFLDRKTPGLYTELVRIGHQECPVLRACGLETVTYRQNREDLRIGRVDHNVDAVLISMGGRGEVFEADEWKVCGPGGVYFIPKETFHAFQTSIDWGWDYSVVRILDEELSRVLVPFSHAHLEPHKNINPIRHAIHGLMNEFYDGADASTIRQWANLVITCLHRLLPVTSETDAKLTYIWDKVGLDLARNWTLDDIANIGGLNRDKLRMLCHEHYGCSPIRHLMHLRMEKAAHEIELGIHDLGMIARRIGYSNEKAFRKAFQKARGVSPNALFAHV